MVMETEHLEMKTSYKLGYEYHPYSVAITDLNQDNWNGHCHSMLWHRSHRNSREDVLV